MGRCTVPLTRRWWQTSGVGKPMGACAWSMPPASAVAVPARMPRAMSMERQCHQEAGARVSVLLHPLRVGSQPILWKDWSRRQHRRACMQLLRHQRVEMRVEPALATASPSPLTSAPLSRAQRAHYRLTFQERLVRNARVSTAGQVTIRLCGVPANFATSLGLSSIA
jgi:hypothetical protein